MKKRYFAMGGLALGITVLCMANVIVSDNHKVIAKSSPDSVETRMSEETQADYELEAITSLDSTSSATESASRRTVTTTPRTTTAVDAVTKISSSNPDDKLPKQIIPEDQTPVAEDQSAGAPNPVVTTTAVTHEDVPETTVMTTAPEVPQEEVVTTVSTEMTTTTPTTTTTTTSATTTTPTTTTRMEVQSELTIAQENWDVHEESASTSSEKKFSLEEVKKFMDHMYSEGYEIPWDSSDDVRDGIVTLGGYPTVVTDSTYDLGDFVETEYGSAMVVDNTANEIIVVRADW